MSRSLSTLRRSLLAIAFVGSLGFGATQAWGSSGARDPDGTCPPASGPYHYRPCLEYCGSVAYCDGYGYCVCQNTPIDPLEPVSD